MHTTFSAAQLADPNLAEANAIIETCVHYGFCTNTCPTYVLTRDENESPRGRIDLIRKMLERGGAPDRKTVQHLDSCLSCLSCMTTCAVKVDYAHLIDRARAHIQQHYRRPANERVMRYLLAIVLPRPRLFLLMLRVGSATRWLVQFIPRRLRHLVDLIPSRPHKSAHILPPGVHPAEAGTKHRVALLAGCAQQALNGNINDATIRLLRRHGCDVIVSDGAARKNITAWQRAARPLKLDAIVINASGCGTTVKDYGHMFARDPTIATDAEQIAAAARDVSEFVLTLDLKPAGAPKAYRVAYHDPCSMRHGQRVIDQPRELLRRVGFDVLDVPEAHFCCGSAGTYNLLHPDTAEVLGRRKTAHIESTNPDIIATGNIGCMIQIARYSRLPVVHSVELLDWATGGPLPPALRGLSLRSSAVRPSAAESTTGEDIAFW